MVGLIPAKLCKGFKPRPHVRGDLHYLKLISLTAYTMPKQSDINGEYSTFNGRIAEGVRRGLLRSKCNNKKTRDCELRRPYDVSNVSFANGCILLGISEVARITKLGEMSDVAFMKRFEKYGYWFKTINKKIATKELINYQKPNW